MTDVIQALKAIRRKNGVICVIIICLKLFPGKWYDNKMYAIDENKTRHSEEKSTDSNGDENKLLNIISTLLGPSKAISVVRL